MEDIIFKLSDYCIAKITEYGHCEDCNPPFHGPTILFDISESFDEQDKICLEDCDPMFCFYCFSEMPEYEQHLNLISDDKIKELIIAFCEFNFEFNCYAKYFYENIKLCNKINNREDLLKLFEEIGNESVENVYIRSE